jgi:hypothetical protein
MGAVNGRRGGYGMVSFEGHAEWAHRVSYIVFKGPIPDGLDACHSCDNPPCVNPDHLFAGTRKENMIDARNKGKTLGRPRLHLKRTPVL